MIWFPRTNFLILIRSSWAFKIKSNTNLLKFKLEEYKFYPIIGPFKQLILPLTLNSSFPLYRHTCSGCSCQGAICWVMLLLLWLWVWVAHAPISPSRNQAFLNGSILCFWIRKSSLCTLHLHSVPYIFKRAFCWHLL